MTFPFPPPPPPRRPVNLARWAIPIRVLLLIVLIAAVLVGLFAFAE
jgi:hypothetical protein